MIESSRRSFITGLIAFVAAPAIVRAANIMPVKADRRFIDIYNGVPIWEVDNISAEVYGRSPMMDVLPNFNVIEGRKRAVISRTDRLLADASPDANLARSTWDRLALEAVGIE